MNETFLEEVLVRACETVVALKEADGNEGRAAMALRVTTQAAVSLRKKAATERYGELFEPASKHRELTRMGEALYKLGKALQRVEREMSEHVLSRTSGEVLRVGYSRSHLALVSAALLALIGAKGSPKIVTTETSPKRVRDLLREKAIDVGVTYPPRIKHGWLEEKPLANLPLALVVNKTHKLAVMLEREKRSRVRAEDLADEPLVLLERDATDLRDEINRYFKRQIPTNIVLEADSVTTLLALARQGLATILPAFPQDDVFKVILLEAPPVKTTSLLWNKSALRKPSANDFADALEEAVRETLKDYVHPELRDSEKPPNTT